MNRGYYILKSAIKRMRGVFPISNGIPFLINLGRSLLFNLENITTTDSVGDETRTLQPDYCITVDGIGGGAYFSTPILDNVSKWAIGFRMSNYVQDNLDFIIGGSGGKNILLDRDTYLGFRDSTGTYYRFDGTVNSQEVVTTNLGTFDVFMYSDGTNIYAWVDGEYKGYITPNDTTIYVDRLVNGYVSAGVPLYMPQGDHYDYRLYDLTSKSATEITDYFDEQGAKFHNNKMEVSDNWKFRRYLMNDKGLAACLDSGNETTKNHGVYFYDDITDPVDYLHNPTLYPTQLRNFHNKEGWNKGAYFNGIDAKINYGNPYGGSYDNIIAKTTFTIDKGGDFSTIFGHRGFHTDPIDGWNIGYYNGSVYYDLNTSDGRYTYNFGIKKGEVYEAIMFIDTTNKVVYRILNGVILSSGAYTGVIDVNTIDVKSGAFNVYYYDGVIFGNSLTNTTETASTVEGIKALITGNLISDPLNGSTTGTPTNVDFNKVLIPNLPNQETDIFGRTPLYKGIAKYNSKVYGGYVAEFNNTGGITVNNKYDGLPYFSATVKIDKSDSTYIWFCENGKSSTTARLFQVLRVNNNKINVGIFDNSLTLYEINSSNSYLQNSTIKIVAYYNDNDLRLIIKDINDNILEDLTNNIGSITLNTSVNDRINFGTNDWYAAPHHLGYMSDIIYKNNGVEVINLYGNNNLTNSISGDEATTNDITFTEVDYTPQSTTDMLKYGGVKRNIYLSPSYNSSSLIYDSSLLPNLDTEVSINVWIYRYENNTSWSTICSEGSGFGTWIWFNLRENKPSFRIENIETIGNIEVPYRTWSMVTLTLSTSNNRVRTYIDGVKDIEIPLPTTLTPLTTYLTLFAISAGLAYGGYKAMNDFRIYDSELSDTEINNLSSNSAISKVPIFNALTSLGYKDIINNIIPDEYGDITTNTIYIPKPQFDLLPTDIRLPSNGLVNYPYCKVDFDPIVWDTYKSYKNIESLDFATDTLSAFYGTVTNAVSFGGYSDVVSFWADNTTGRHWCYTDADIINKNVRFITQIYVPSTNTNVNGANVRGASSGFGVGSVSTLDEWVTVEANIIQPTSDDIRILPTKDSNEEFTGANSPTDDIIYVRNLIVDEVIEHVDYDSRSQNILKPLSEWDDYIDAGISVVNEEIIFNNVAGGSTISEAMLNNIEDGKTYIMLAKTEVNSGGLIFSVDVGSQTVYTSTASEIIGTVFTASLIADASDFGLYADVGGFDGKVWDLEIFPLEYNNTIGHIPHLIFNKLSITGNGMNLPEIFNEDMYEILDLTNPYTWTTEELINFLSYVNVAYEGFLYADILYDADDNPISIKGIYVYDRKLTDIEDEYNESIDFDYINLEQQDKYPNGIPMYINDDDENLPILIT